MKIIVKLGAALVGLIGGALLFDAMAERTANKVVEKLILQESSDSKLNDKDILEPDEIN